MYQSLPKIPVDTYNAEGAVLPEQQQQQPQPQMVIRMDTSSAEYGRAPSPTAENRTVAILIIIVSALMIIGSALNLLFSVFNIWNAIDVINTGGDAGGALHGARIAWIVINGLISVVFNVVVLATGITGIMGTYNGQKRLTMAKVYVALLVVLAIFSLIQVPLAAIMNKVLGLTVSMEGMNDSWATVIVSAIMAMMCTGCYCALYLTCGVLNVKNVKRLRGTTYAAGMVDSQPPIYYS